MGWSEHEMAAKKKGAWKAYLGSFLGNLVEAVVLFYFLDVAGTLNVKEGLLTAFLIWLGFLATVGLSSWLYEGRKFSLYLVNTGHELTVLLVMAAVLSVW